MSEFDDLTPRHLWQSIMHYRLGEFGRLPVFHFVLKNPKSISREP